MVFWVDYLVNIIAVFTGGLITYFIAKWQISRDLAQRKKAFLTNLLSELEFNLKNLNKLDRLVLKGPEIDHLWTPAAVIAKLLHNEAWAELIKAGVLPLLNDDDAEQFRISNSAVMEVKRTIEVIEANWVSIKEWHEADLIAGNQPLTQRRLYIDQAVNEGKVSISYAVKQLNVSIDNLRRIIQEERK